MEITAIFALCYSFLVPSFCGGTSDQSNSLFDFSKDHFPFKSVLEMLSQEEALKTIEKDEFFIDTKKENYEENKESPKRKNENAEAQQRWKFPKIAQKFSYDLGKIDRVVHDFAQFRMVRMGLIDRVIRAQSLREEMAKRQIKDPSLVSAKTVQFSLLKLNIFSTAKTIDTAMIGIEIALCPFENVWQNAKGERMRLVDFVLDGFTLLAVAIMGMERPANALVKETIGTMRRRFAESGKRQLMTALELLAEVEKIVDAIPSPSSANGGQFQEESKLNNLDFYMAYFSAIVHMFLPSTAEAITDSSPTLQKLCDKIQMFAFSLANELKRIRKLMEKR